jgi:hypothetical protein
VRWRNSDAGEHSLAASAIVVTRDVLRGELSGEGIVDGTIWLPSIVCGRELVRLPPGCVRH